MTPSIERVTALIEAAGAEEVMPRFRELEHHELRHKAGGEPVTVADEATEARLAQGLTDLMPGAAIVGEEAVAKDPSGLAALDSDQAAWIIDPIDGTANFAAGRPAFVIMVALVMGREIRMSWIHEPLSGSTAVAEAGSGAWRDGQRLTASKPNGPDDLRGTLHSGRFGGPELDRRVQRLRPQLGAVKSLRCAGLEYVRLASGENHYCLFTKLMPWDHAPGVLLFREAGGLAKLCDGRNYQAQILEGPPLLMASEAALWSRLQGLIWPD